ncbi:MAG: NYN domain-containing protein [Tissierellales bacterium]|nr:NYN domain-containing protein [Tissierellales bacterium]
MKWKDKEMETKKKEYLYVDGYNIINSWEELKELSKISLEEARISLLEILSEYLHYSKIDITVVFDAYMVKGNITTIDEYKGVKVVYTKENELADHYIEKALDEIGRLKKVTVATSDKLEQDIILQKGGIRISALELKAEIENAKRAVERKRKRMNMQNDIQVGKLEDLLKDTLDKWKKEQ